MWSCESTSPHALMRRGLPERLRIFVAERGVHGRVEANEHALVTGPALDHGGRGVGAQPGGGDQVVLGEDADGGGPFERGERLVQWAAGSVLIREEPRRFAGAQEEVRERVRPVVEGAGLARGCGKRHCDIITLASTQGIEEL